MFNGYQKDTSNAIPSTEGLIAGNPTDGNPSLAVPATQPGAAWFHMITQELVNAVTALGLTPNKTTLNQLATAILTLKFPTGSCFEYSSEENFEEDRIVYVNKALYLCIASNGPDSSIVVPGTDDNVWQKIPLKRDILSIIPDATTTVKGKVQLCDNIADEPENQSKAVTPHAVAVYVSAGGRKPNDIGIVGRQGFGVSFPDATEDELAAIGMTPMNGTYDKTSDNYGNFMSDNGGQFVYIPHHYVRYGEQTEDDYDVYGANVLGVKSHDAYNSEAEANADGYFSPRAFYDGSESVNQQGFFMQKYEPNGKTLDGVVYAYGDGSARGMASITPEVMMTRARNLGSDYFVASYFMHQAMDTITLLQGQHSTGTANCAWWKSRGGANYPTKGWSSSNPALYSHNGQKNGIMMADGYTWEFALGVTTPGSSATQGQTAIGNNKIFLLKPTVKMKDLTNDFGGSVGANDVWGNATHLATIYDEFDTTDHFSMTTSRTWYWGNGSNQMYIQPVRNGELDAKARDSFMLIPNSEQSISSAQNTMIGPSLSYTNPCTQNLALYVHGENVNSSSTTQNVFSRAFHSWRVLSSGARSFRCGAYLRDN